VSTRPLRLRPPSGNISPASPRESSQAMRASTCPTSRRSPPRRTGMHFATKIAARIHTVRAKFSCSGVFHCSER
jgi:hypothetical protein